MALICYRQHNFSLDRSERILQINALLAEYSGNRVSVRQMYYRLVAKGLIANNDTEYGKIQNLITDARYAGLIDWEAIEDRNREPLKMRDWPNGKSAVDEIAAKFRLDRWRDQPFYLELWVEKAALAGVLSPIANDYHITLMVNRGYSSASAMKESAERITYHGAGRRAVVLYLGDFDPSGEDMVRDIRDRLLEFGVQGWTAVHKIGLTAAQIQQYNPPPNPVKLTDVRAAAFRALHGDSSYEVDALEPPVTNLLVRTQINAYVDKAKMTAVIAEENLIKKKLAAITF